MALTDVYTGAHGTISLAVEGSDAQKADFAAITTAYGDTAFNPLGRVEDVQICIQTELQEFYEIGNREVNQLSPGNVHISGKIGRAYINGSLLFLLLGRGGKVDSKPTLQPRFTLNLLLQDPADPNDQLRLNVFGVKFENWALQVPQSTFVMEHLTFKAVRAVPVDQNEGTEINVAFPTEEEEETPG
jgi:hypothetical protein